MAFDCNHEIPESSKNVIIKSRVETLERITRQHSKRLETGAEDDYSRNSTPRSLRGELGQDGDSPPPGVVVVKVQKQEPDQQGQANSADGMAISTVDEEDCGYFGPSSNIALMRIIFRAMARRGRVPNTTSPSPPGWPSVNMVSMPRPQLPSTRDAGPAVQPELGAHNFIPPDHETEALIERYFSTTGVLFPYIHKPSFMETYYRSREHGFRVEVRRTWLGLLNMILAMARRMTNLRRYRMPTSSIGVRRSYAKHRCFEELHWKPVVQYLLLTSQYLQGTHKPVQTWITHGLAVKAALSIGLHSHEASRGLPQIEQEMRKRTWYGCVMLDRSLSMTYGRPSTISEDYVRLDLPTPVIGDATEDISVAFYNATIMLYKILWNIMGKLYGHNLGCGPLSGVDTITQIFHLQQSLDEWRDKLPVALHLVSSSNLADVNPDASILERFRFVLTLRYLNTQLLLQRPLLTELLKAEVEEPVQDQKFFDRVLQSLTPNCARPAEEIISIIHSVLTRENLGESFLGAWWFNIYYTFNAGLVVFGNLLIKDELNVESHHLDQMEKGRQILRKAIEALLHLSSGSALIDRCVAYLQRLLQLVGEWVIPRAAIGGGNIGPTMSQDLGAPGIADMNYSADMKTDGFLGMPPFQNNFEFQDEMELGPFVNNEFQRWFAGTSWQDN
ncbi:c6 zinc finger domain containing [Fusarium albosuccineum]|uniref:C6 zinc finger domain containing n=1 Tax=Fusarium albosuccineum TaxID=1237068 RepID=A0A8H4PE40_9HYPO|nr:c6 zinc finger domain containing [Fusarium albosuccineum]